jgi:hypothetical protein
MARCLLCSESMTICAELYRVSSSNLSDIYLRVTTYLPNLGNILERGLI